MVHNDEPTLFDQIGRKDFVQMVGQEVIRCQAPQVFGVHGDWGCGKTSFLHQLHWFLKGECPESRECNRQPNNTDWPDWKPKDHITVVWFEAWRYQNESNPVVALLHEIRTQLQWHIKLWNEAKKLGEVASYGALFGMESLTKYLRVAPSKVQEAGEKWEKEHFATQLPTHIIRGLLDQSIRQLIGSEGDPKPRLVILIDDLDRCESEAAYRLLEGIKIYLNIPSCVFVIGMDQHVVELAVRNHVGGTDAEKSLLAAEYVEKICRNIWHLPLDQSPHGLLAEMLGDTPGAQQVCDVVAAYKCLPGNPRKTKTFAHIIDRFLTRVHYDPTQWAGGPTRFTSLPQTLPRKANDRDLDPLAGLLVAMASLYQFHHAAYRILEGDPKFYEVVRLWAAGKRKHERLDDIRLVTAPLFFSPEATFPLPEVKAPLPEAKAPTPQPQLEPTFPDPARGNVFRVQSLVTDLGEIAEDDIRACILGSTAQP